MRTNITPPYSFYILKNSFINCYERFSRRFRFFAFIVIVVIVGYPNNFFRLFNGQRHFVRIIVFYLLNMYYFFAVVAANGNKNIIALFYIFIISPIIVCFTSVLKRVFTINVHALLELDFRLFNFFVSLCNNLHI